jgi:hypothetical protein
MNNSTIKKIFILEEDKNSNLEKNLIPNLPKTKPNKESFISYDEWKLMLRKARFSFYIVYPDK